jgi:hypothetical protein
VENKKMKRSIQSLLLAAALSVTPTFAGPAVVGVATALGSFSVNNGSVSGTANLTDGAQLQTGDVTSQVMLKGGSSVLFGTNSAGSVYSNKVVLEKGIARLDNLKPSFSVSAASLNIQNDQVGGQGAVRINGDKVEVAALVGNMNVYNQRGTLLTRVAAGTVVSVDDPQSGATDDQNQNSNNKKDCTGSHKKDPGCDANVPSGSGAGGGGTTIMSNTAALWVTLGLAALGAGLGVGLSQSSSKTPSP